MNSEEVENFYVRDTYKKLASLPFPALGRPSIHEGPELIVKEFLANEIQPHRLVVDVGCGRKATRQTNGFYIGLDNCLGVLIRKDKCGSERTSCDFVLGDALSMPFRPGLADVVLCISVLHHFASVQRRLKLLVELSSIMRGQEARALVCVWALEQANGGRFAAKDILLSAKAQELPNQLTHVATRGQRIIASSIPVSIASRREEEEARKRGIRRLANNRLLREWILWLETQMMLPIYYNIQRMDAELGVSIGVRQTWVQWRDSILSSIGYYAPFNVAETFAETITRCILEQALNEARAHFKNAIYRYYHLFEGGELETLIGAANGLSVVSSGYDGSNWFAVVGLTK